MADGKKLLGLPRNVVIFGGVGALAVVGYLWYRNRQQQAADASSQDSSSSQGGYSGAFSPAPAVAYGANMNEIIATVNGPSAGDDDDDEQVGPIIRTPGPPPPGPKPPVRNPPPRGKKPEPKPPARRPPPKRKPPTRRKKAPANG